MTSGSKHESQQLAGDTAFPADNLLTYPRVTVKVVCDKGVTDG